ncbi:MAG TPA: isocitrate lyase/PEP mutase family protein [Stellaceae bacterium]|jgi:carboxyvinyl-carboxyphosphonate phosphorylmutase|nr:isocitrate lyase/PEP mutase family protein [Stellaceae bacterium]
MYWSERRENFRAVLAGARCVYPASVFDPMSARLAADLGYEIGMFSGSVASLTILGAPDLVVLTLTEFADQALRINRAGGLPLMVDADHGYGNALNVKRTVEELETAGVCGLSIEDTLLPAPFGAPEKPQLLSIDEGVGKMRAALAGRQDKRLVIVGRSSSIGITGLADTIARAKAYEAAGVDAFFVAGAKTRAEIEAVAAAIRIPLVIGAPAPELQDLDFLSAQRVRICIQGHLPIAAAVRAAYETLKALREGVKPKDVAGIASPELMKQATRDADYRRWIKEFLGG